MPWYATLIVFLFGVMAGFVTGVNFGLFEGRKREQEDWMKREQERMMREAVMDAAERDRFLSVVADARRASQIRKQSSQQEPT